MKFEIQKFSQILCAHMTTRAGSHMQSHRLPYPGGYHYYTERNGIFREVFSTLFCGTERTTRASYTITIVGFSIHRST